VVTGYFAQHHTERLDPSLTVLEEVHGLVPTQPQSWVRGVLGAFLFSGDDVDKRISVLSGGERARVALGPAAGGALQLPAHGTSRPTTSISTRRKP